MLTTTPLDDMFLKIIICFAIFAIVVLPFINTDLFLFRKMIVRTLLIIILLWILLNASVEIYVKSLVMVLIIMLMIKSHYEQLNT